MADHPDALMLFAAGFGTRMRPLTDSLPKPLIKVAGKPLMDHALAQADALKIARKVANLHYLPDMLARHLDGTGVTPVFEPRLLDTGGGLRAALPNLGPGPVFTLNTDAVWRGGSPLATLAQHWDPARMDALLLCVPTDRAIGHKGAGDFSIRDDGRLTRGGPWTYVGAQIVRPDGLLQIPETCFSLNLLWDQMGRDGRLFGAVYPGQWCDVGHPAGIKLAEAMLEGTDA